MEEPSRRLIVKRHQHRLAQLALEAAHRDVGVQECLGAAHLNDDTEVLVLVSVPLGILRELKQHMAD